MFILALMSLVVMFLSGVQLVASGAYVVGFTSLGFATISGVLAHFSYKVFGRHKHQHHNSSSKKKWYHKLDCIDCDCDCLDCD